MAKFQKNSQIMTSGTRNADLEHETFKKRQ